MSESPVVVLVHGAWGPPAMWDDVVPELPNGTEVVVADLPTCTHPGTGLADDAAHVREITGDRPAVLVGHSYGGAVITEAAGAIPDARHLVYLAAVMPAPGESMLEWSRKRPTGWEVPIEFFEDGTSLVVLDEAHAPPYDSRTLARLEAIGMRRFAIDAVTTPLTQAAWKTIPSTYLIAAADTLIHPDSQREMAARATTVREIDAEHQLPLSHPVEVAALIATTLEA